MRMRKLLGKTVFKLYGWDYEIDPSVIGLKQVVIGFEHTSQRDGILSIALFGIVGLKIHTLIKQELFRGPLKPVMQAIGGIPVDRKKSGDVVQLMVEEFARRSQFTLVIAPEGTRAKNGEPRKPIRTGFWHIAKQANVPIVLMYANPATRQGGLFARIIPGDLQHDLQQIKRLYAEKGLDIVIPTPQ